MRIALHTLMTNLTRRSRLFQFVLITMALGGCAAAVDDDGTLAPIEDAPGSTSEALKEAAVTKGGAVLDAEADGCAAAPAKAAAQTDAYQEYMSIIEPASPGVDAAPVGNSCSAACRCCAWGNRFCCSHCKWCSWPVATSPEVLAP